MLAQAVIRYYLQYQIYIDIPIPYLIIYILNRSMIIIMII